MTESHFFYLLISLFFFCFNMSVTDLESLRTTDIDLAMLEMQSTRMEVQAD